MLSRHLAEIAKQVAPAAHAVLVLDGAGYHIASDLVVPDNLTLLILPPYSSELSLIENVWQYLRQNNLGKTSGPKPSSTHTPISSTPVANPEISSPMTSKPSPR